MAILRVMGNLTGTVDPGVAAGWEDEDGGTATAVLIPADMPQRVRTGLTAIEEFLWGDDPPEDLGLDLSGGRPDVDLTGSRVLRLPALDPHSLPRAQSLRRLRGGGRRRGDAHYIAHRSHRQASDLASATNREDAVPEFVTVGVAMPAVSAITDSHGSVDRSATAEPPATTAIDWMPVNLPTAPAAHDVMWARSHVARIRHERGAMTALAGTLSTPEGRDREVARHVAAAAALSTDGHTSTTPHSLVDALVTVVFEDEIRTMRHDIDYIAGTRQGQERLRTMLVERPGHTRDLAMQLAGRYGMGTDIALTAIRYALAGRRAAHTDAPPTPSKHLNGYAAALTDRRPAAAAV